MAEPLRHLVFGGNVKDPKGHDFVDSENLDIIGVNGGVKLDRLGGAKPDHLM
jgi:hypothetical protein